MTIERIGGALATAVSRWGSAAVIRCATLTADQLLARIKRRRDFRAHLKERREERRQAAMKQRLAKRPASPDGAGAS